MTESHNVEIAHQLSEREEAEGPKHRWERIAEVLEVLALAVAAIATAWSGFQASGWDGRQALLYGESTSQRFEASAASTTGGQELVADSAMFTGWLQARALHNPQLATTFERRFTPDYHAAFNEWLQTDPLNDPSAPPGPAYMPGYQNPNLAKADTLNAEAAQSFVDGTEAGHHADDYVRLTVLFALVLFLIAAGQRFRQRPVRLGANGLAVALLVFAMAYLVTLPRQ